MDSITQAVRVALARRWNEPTANAKGLAMNTTDKSLAEKIKENRTREARRDKAERILRAVRVRIFDYEDEGREEKARQIIARCKAILRPRWEARAANVKRRMDERMLFLTE